DTSITGKLVQILLEADPALTRILAMFHTDTPGQQRFLPAIEAAAASAGIEVVSSPVASAADITGRITATQRPSATGLVVVPGPFLNGVNSQLVVDLATRAGMPSIFPDLSPASRGGLISYGIDVADLWRRAVPYTDQILRGANPGELPIQFPIKFNLIV